jgi:hypothetical protein
MAERSFAPIPDRDPAPLDQPISAHSGFLTDDALLGYLAAADHNTEFGRPKVDLFRTVAKQRSWLSRHIGPNIYLRNGAKGSVAKKVEVNQFWLSLE